MFVEEKVIPTLPQPTLAGLHDWLAHQPPQTMYDYDDIQKCPLGQYYRSIGREPRRFASELFDSYAKQTEYMFALGCVEWT